MAQMHEQMGPAEAQERSGAGIINLAGAALSLALMSGAVVWGYQLLMRDVSGIPVIEAEAGPMRIQPDEPGGQTASNQGLAVNAVAAEGTAARPADRIALAPPPIDLSEISLAKFENEGAAGEDQETLVMAVYETPAADPMAEEGMDISEAEAEDSAAKGGLDRSLRPRIRPATFSPPQPQAAISASTEAETQSVEISEVAPGTRLAQLGAYESAEIAAQEWGRMSKQFGEYLDGKERVIQKAESGGKTFYRLRVKGFADLSDARRFCSALVAESADCIPVTTR